MQHATYLTNKNAPSSAEFKLACCYNYRTGRSSFFKIVRIITSGSAKRDACIGYSCQNQAADKNAAKAWLQQRIYDSTSIRRPFDCLSKVIKVTVT